MRHDATGQEEQDEADRLLSTFGQGVALGSGDHGSLPGLAAGVDGRRALGARVWTSFVHSASAHHDPGSGSSIFFLPTFSSVSTSTFDFGLMNERV